MSAVGSFGAGFVSATDWYSNTTSTQRRKHEYAHKRTTREYTHKGGGMSTQIVTPELLDAIRQAVTTAVTDALANQPTQCVTLTPTQAAERLGVSRRHFDECILPNLYHRRSGTRLLIPTAEVDRWLMSGTPSRVPAAARTDSRAAAFARAIS